MSSENSAWLDRFEPIGVNCEMGFVLGSLGSQRPSLFRWNSIQPPDLRRLLDERFDGVLALETTAPHGPGMVRDVRFDWCLHSALTGEDGQFACTGTDLVRLHRIERAKVLHDAKVFSQRLAEGVICVLQIKAMAPEEMAAVLQAIDRHAGNEANQLLVVTEPTGEDARPGTVVTVAPRLMQGVVGWVAPWEQADKADYASWSQILRSLAPATEDGA